MTTFNPLKLLIVPAMLMGSGVALAQSPHWDRPSCYIHVHDGCFNNQSDPCTEDEYNGFLDNCNTTYPGQTAKRPVVDQTLLPASKVVFNRSHRMRMRQLEKELFP